MKHASIPGLRVHIPELDGLRGIAVTMVFVYHLHLFGGVGEPGSIYAALVSIGWSGVDLFFVLSGLLITGILLDSRDAPKYFQKFYARRILRIFPLYYATVAAVFVLGPFVLPRAELARLHPETQIFAWTFTLNYPFGIDPVRVCLLIQPLWSLAVEEQFYLFWPLIVYLLTPKNFRRTCFALILAALLTRIGLMHAGWVFAAFTFTPTRLDALAAGALLALALRSGAAVQLGKHAWKLAAASFLGILTLTLFRGASLRDPYVATAGLSLMAIFYVSSIAAILCAPAGSRIRRPFCAAPLRMLGKYSYAIYMFHQAVIVALSMTALSSVALASRMHSRIAANLTFAAMAAAVTLAAAMASWWLLEKRFLALKRAFPY